jgi:hypothetical protein
MREKGLRPAQGAGRRAQGSGHRAQGTGHRAKKRVSGVREMGLRPAQGAEHRATLAKEQVVGGFEEFVKGYHPCVPS